MRTLGVICVALGLFMLLMSFFPIIFAESSSELFMGLGCAAFLALPLFLTGIVLTRRFAAHSGPETEAKASADLTRKATDVLNYLSLHEHHVGKIDPHGTLMERLRAFDVNSLTVAGWLLVFASGGFLLGEVLLFKWLILQDRQKDLGPVGGFWFLGEILLVIAFFYTGRLLLGVFGVPISKGVDAQGNVDGAEVGSRALKRPPPDRSKSIDQTSE
jgi:hypothetical protein